MRLLGYGARESYNRYCYEESSPVTNLFLGLKYMIEVDGNVEENPYFDPVHSSGDVTLLKNNAYLPLGFLADVQLANVNFQDGTEFFAFQNSLLAAASGVTEPVWTLLNKNSIDVSSEDVQVSSSSAGYCTYVADTAGTIIYTITPKQAGFMCVSLKLPKQNGYSVRLNDELLFSETYSIPQTMAISYVEPGDVVEIHLRCKAGEKSNMTIRPAILDDEAFRKAYDVLNASTLNLTAFSSTRVEGTISCNRDGLLYTSIPQNGNWLAYVDGKEADIVLIGDCMIGVPLTEGEHTITFQYHNRSYSLGLKITLLSAALFIGIIVTVYRPARKKGKYEK